MNKKTFIKLLGMNIKRYRGFRGLFQKDLAEKISTTNTTISDWENGKSTISSYDLSLICKALNIEPTILLNFSEIQEENK